MGYDPCSLNEIFFAKELMKKWRVGSKELEQYIKNGLGAYYFEPAKRPKIRLKNYSCGRIGINIEKFPQKQETVGGLTYRQIDWDSIVFDADDVKSFESENPELLEYNIDNALSFYDVQTRLGLSPGLLLDALNQGKIRTNFEKQFVEDNNNYEYNKFEYADIGEPCPPKDDFFTEDNAKNITIHEVDLEEALENFPELNRKEKQNADKINAVKFSGVPNNNNSVWLSVDDLKYRWGVEKFDIVSRLRTGDLYSNRYDPERKLYFFSSLMPDNLYPDETIHEVACNLYDHIWPHEEKYLYLKKAAAKWYNDYAERYIGLRLPLYNYEEMEMNKGNRQQVSNSVNNVTSVDSKAYQDTWIPANIARKAIQKSPGQFIDILDKGMIETDREDERRQAKIDWEVNKQWIDKKLVTVFSFFKIKDIEGLNIHSVSLATYIENNKDGITTSHPTVPEVEDKNASLRKRIDDLESTNKILQSRLDAASAPPHRWKSSCDALFQTFRQIVESTRDDWVQDEFLALAGRLYDNNGDKRGVLAEAGRLAWAALPDRFKAGPGNPKYKSNPTKG